VQVLKNVTIEKGELATFVKKKVKTKFIDLDHAGNDKLLNRLLLSLGCWLMLARRFCVYSVGLKVDVAWEILTVIMMSNDKNVCSCKTHSSSSLVLFLAIALPFLGLVTHYCESWYYNLILCTLQATMVSTLLENSFLYVNINCNWIC